MFLLVFSALCAAQVKPNLSADSSGYSSTIPRGNNEYANVHCGLQDKNGKLWFGTTGAGIYCYDGEVFRNFTMNEGLRSNEVWCAYEDLNGNLWFGTGDGVCRFDATSLADGTNTFTNLRMEGETESTSKYLSPFNINHSEINAVWSVLQDKTDKFWFGTSNGVYCYDGQVFTPFLNNDSIVNNDGLELKHIQCILEDKKGNIWFASWNQEGACCFDGKTLTSIRPNGDGMVHAILEDREGNLWFGTRNNGACRYDGETFTDFSDIEGFGKICIYSMAEDSTGNIWFATEPGGVWCYNPVISTSTGIKSLTHFTTEHGLSNNAVFCVLSDQPGNLWFGTRGIGLCRFDGKIFTQFSE